MGGFKIQDLLRVDSEGGSTNIKMLTVTHSRRGWRVESKNVKVLLFIVVGEEVMKRISGWTTGRLVKYATRDDSQIFTKETSFISFSFVFFLF